MRHKGVVPFRYPPFNPLKQCFVCIFTSRFSNVRSSADMMPHELFEGFKDWNYQMKFSARFLSTHGLHRNLTKNFEQKLAIARRGQKWPNSLYKTMALKNGIVIFMQRHQGQIHVHIVFRRAMQWQFGCVLHVGEQRACTLDGELLEGK